MQRGFIQIPILIAIIIGIVALGGTGYFAYEVGKTSQNPSPKESAAESQATTTANATTTTSIEIGKKTTDSKDSVIGSLQKQVSDLTKKVNTPKIEAPKTPSATETPKVIVTPTVSASTNPAAKCLDPKKKWDDFIKGLNDTDKKLSALFSSYNKSAWGTENKPSNVVAQFSYNYERMNPAKTKFYFDADAVEKTAEAIPAPLLSDTNGIDQIKKNYPNSVTSLKNAYDLTLSAFKVIADDDDGLSKTEIDTSLALLTDGGDKYDEALSTWKLNNPFLSDYDYRSLKKALNSQNSSNGCAFTFASDNTIVTTITNEELFTQQNPKSEATADGAALISIKTKLPIEISEAGQTKTVLKLMCNGESRPVMRVDENTVGNLIGKSYNSIRVQCNFVYSGNGKDLSTRILDFNW